VLAPILLGQGHFAQLDEDNNSWWAGAQKCFASIALAAALLVSSAGASAATAVANSQQDELHVSQIATEDLWQNPVAPVSPIFGRLYLPDPEEIPAGKLYGQPDEDYWVNSVFPQAYPTPSTKAFSDDEIIASIPFQPDEDYWQNPVFSAPYYFGRIYFPDSDDVPAGSLHGQPDEDYWQNRVAPVPPIFSWPQPFSFEQHENAAGLYGQPDEDFWLNWVRPVPPLFQWPQPYQFEQDENAAGLYGQPEESIWTPRIAPAVYPNLYKIFSDDDVIVAQPVIFQPDEDTWVNFNRQAPYTFFWPQPYQFDQEENAASLFGQYDEDFWKNAVAPVSPATYTPQPFNWEQNEPAANLHGAFEEDFWKSPQPWTVFATPSVFQSDEYAIVSTFLPDEDFWEIPAPWNADVHSTLFRESEFDILQSFIPTEEYFPNLIIPDPPNFYLPIFWQDQEEIQFIPVPPQPLAPQDIGALINVSEVVNGLEEFDISEPINDLEEVSLADVIQDPDMAQNFTITRSSGSWVNGTWTQTTTQLQAFGVIEVGTPKDIHMSMEADIIEGSITVWTVTPIFTTHANGSNNPGSSDLITWHGDLYRVMQVSVWRDYGYYRAVCVRQKMA
jgi:hypothetical protein